MFMVDEGYHNSGPVPQGTRCVILTPPGGSVPARLLSGLSRRGVSMAVVADPVGVMVELSRASLGVLIVIEPDRQPNLAELIQAMITYYPRTVRWCYRAQADSGKPGLTPLNGQKVGQETSSPAMGSSFVGENNHDAPPLDPAHRSPLARAQSDSRDRRMRSLVVKVPAPPGVDQPLISEEELAMLLGPAPDKYEDPQ